MKNFYHYIILLAVFGFLIFNPAMQMLAQEKTDFHSELYREAIQNIVTNSNGKLTFEDVIRKLESPEKPPPITQGTREGFELIPEIQLISFDDISADFYYSPTSTTIDTATYTVDWITEYTVDNNNYSISFTTEQNTTPVPRSCEVIVIDTVDGVPQTAIGYILQGPVDEPYIFISPRSAMVPFLGQEDLTFNIDTVNLTGSLEIDFDQSTVPNGWTATLENGPQLKLVVPPNTLSVTLIAKIYVVDDDPNSDIKDSVSIFQYAQPDTLLLVSPKFLAMPPASGVTETVTVTTLNVENWEPIDMADWISGFNKIGNTVTFTIDENDSGGERNDNVYVEDSDNPDIRDTLIIYQYANTSDYIIATPSIGYLNPNANDFEVRVNANVPWGLEFTDVPDGMIPDTTVYPDSAVIFHITPNDGELSRTAKISIVATNGTGVSTLVQINQAAESLPYIFVSPEISNVGPDLGSISLNVDANVSFSANTLDDPFGMLSNFQIQDETITFDISANDTTVTRIAKGWAYNEQDTSISDTFYIIQNAAYILLDPREKLVSHEGAEFEVEVTRYFVNEITFDDSNFIGQVTNQNNESLLINVPPNLDTISRIDTLIVCSASNAAICDTLTIFQYANPASYILLAPRSDTVQYFGDDEIIFDITAVNLSGELTIDNSSVPDWISASLNGNQLQLDVDTNQSNQTRIAAIYVYDSGDQEIRDSVLIFQYANPESYILMAPRSDTVQFIGGDEVIFDITAFNLSGVLTIENNTMPGWISAVLTGNQLQLDVDANSLSETRETAIYVYDSESPEIRDSVLIFQYANPESYILMAPRSDTIQYIGDEVIFEITAVNPIGTLTIDDLSVPDWITSSLNGDQLQLDVDANSLHETRETAIYVYYSDSAEIRDSVVIFQYANPESYILMAPRSDTVQFFGDDEVVFDITAVNPIGTLTIDDLSVPDWISASLNGDQLQLDVDANPLPETRETAIYVYYSDSAEIRDSVVIFQYATPESYILLDPRSDTVQFFGDDEVIFDITAVNPIGTLTIDDNSVPDWISAFINGNQLILDVDTNQSNQTRETAIYIFYSDSAEIRDSVVIFQYAGSDPVIIVSPREQIIYQAGGIPSVPFVVTTYGMESWAVSSKPDWIQVLNQGELLLVLNIEPNPDLETRIGTVYVTPDPEISGVFDSIKIYQYSAFDSYLLASPREKSFGQAEVESSLFEVTKANVLNWETDLDNLPNWIEVNASGEDILDLKIHENTSYDTRQDSVFIFSNDNNGARDTILIYQYAANDTLLLAAPRQQLIPFGGGNPVFDITIQNAEAWKVEVSTVPEWITVTSQGGNQLALSVELNSTDTTRFTTLKIYDTLNPQVEDFISIFQYAAPESYILAAPRSDTVSFSGDPLVTFDITTVNLIGNLSIDQNTVPEWISATLNGNLLELDVESNNLNSTRDTVIYIFDSGNDLIFDSVSIYQYAAPESYILAAPREQQIGHTGGSLFYTLTAININNLLVDEATIPSWVSDYSISTESLILQVDTNFILQTKEATIHIFNADNPSVKDSVSVYQYSGLDYYLLAAPAERKTSHLATILHFDVTAANLSEPWQSEILEGDNILEIINQGSDSLSISINENQSPNTRRAKIKIFSVNHESAADTIEIYQYTAFEPYIILDYSYRDLDYFANTYSIVVYSNLDSANAVKGNTNDWYGIIGDGALHFVDYSDTLWFFVKLNENYFHPRSAFLNIASTLSDTVISDNFYFRQLSNPNESFFNISGTVLSNDTALAGVRITVDDSTKFTDNEGRYTHQVLNGWIGLVNPEIEGFFFDPPNAVFNDPLKNDTVVNFTAIEINPKIQFNIEGDTIPICPGEQIDFSSSNYPTLSITGTFGPRSFKWFSEPEDPDLNTDSTATPAYPFFGPDSTTTYSLVLYNYNNSDTTQFTVKVNPSPEKRDFEGPETVCRNQAGVIYSVTEFENGEYFQWKLKYNGALVKEYNSNIVTIDWGNQAGDHQLTLFTINETGCRDSISKTILVTQDTAPPKTLVEKKSGDNMLVSTNTNSEIYNFQWGWYELSNGGLGEKYIIPDRNDWYCRLPEGHVFNQLKFSYFVILTLKDGSGCESLSFLDGNAPVNVDELNKEVISIFPNPTSGSIWLRISEYSPSESVLIKMRDITGQVVYTKEFTVYGESPVIHIEATQKLQPGIYFLEADTGAGVYNSKIVMQ